MAWKSWVWAVVAAVLSGYLVASLLGTTPSWGGFVVVVVLIGAGVAVVGSGVRRRARDTRPLREPQAPEERAQAERVIGEVTTAVTRQNIDWLRAQDFTMPWRESQIEPYRQLLRLEIDDQLPPNGNAAFALHELMEATMAFLDFYAQNTFPDRLLRNDEWRDVGWGPTDSQALEGVELEVFELRHMRLREAALDLVAAYDTVVEAAWQHVPAGR